MKQAYYLMGLLVAILILLAGYRGGSHLIWDGFKQSGLIFSRVSLLLLFAFCVTGLLQGLIREETIRKLLGKEAGFKGVLLGGIAGALMPGGPYVIYPLVVTFLTGGAEIGALLAFVLAKSLWTLVRIPMELALIGWPLFISRFVVTMPVPLLVGFFANLLFPRVADGIRVQLLDRKTPARKDRQP
ncbi:MAG: permease [Desulfobacterales bacterium]|nr:permease [Desulfobacterales bacterium]